MEIDPRLVRELAVTAREARVIQERLRHRVVRSDRAGAIGRVAGIDVAFPVKDRAQAAVVVLALPGLEIVERHVASVPLTFPYVPGLLSFRELPAIFAVLAKLRSEPDLFMCDGQGYAHPRRLGLASHLGVLLERPAVGVAKSRLVGEHADVPGNRGAWVPLMDRGERIGAVLRSRANVRPLYVSVGHRLSLRNAIRQVMRCVTRFRLPEPTRLADRLSRRQPA